MTMRTASIPSKDGTADEPLRLRAAADPTAIIRRNGRVMGWHPVIDMPAPAAA